MHYLDDFSPYEEDQYDQYDSFYGDYSDPPQEFHEPGEEFDSHEHSRNDSLEESYPKPDFNDNYGYDQEPDAAQQQF